MTKQQIEQAKRYRDAGAPGLSYYQRTYIAPHTQIWHPDALRQIEECMRAYVPTLDHLNREQIEMLADAAVAEVEASLEIFGLNAAHLLRIPAFR